MGTLVDASSVRPGTGGIEVAPPSNARRQTPDFSGEVPALAARSRRPVATRTMDVDKQGAPSARVRAEAELLRSGVDTELYDVRCNGCGSSIVTRPDYAEKIHSARRGVNAWADEAVAPARERRIAP